LAELLACPDCSASLELEIQARDPQEILAGLLHCARCRCDFPIQEGMPRFALSDAYATSEDNDVSAIARAHGLVASRGKVHDRQQAKSQGDAGPCVKPVA
jgi:uncharacterized protein YbaR (Trm112 family)